MCVSPKNNQVPRILDSITARPKELSYGDILFTEVGGDILSVEVCGEGSKGQVMMKQMGHVLASLPVQAFDLGLNEDFYETVDIHVHVPEGSIPGRKAGITMACAMASALTNRPVTRYHDRRGFRGRVLPIGGVKEKVKAVYRAGSCAQYFPGEPQT